MTVVSSEWMMTPPGRCATFVDVPDTSLPHEDLRATLAARRDLGPAYEDALVDSFIEKLDNEITRRVQAEVARRGEIKPAKPDNSHIPIALGSLGIGVPLTAIAVSQAGSFGLMLAWGGIVLVNMAAAIRRKRP